MKIKSGRDTAFFVIQGNKSTRYVGGKKIFRKKRKLSW